MYRIRYEGGVFSAERGAIEAWVPARLNAVVRAGLSVGNALIRRWFGVRAVPGGAVYDDFDAKRRKMNDYLNSQCQVLSFVKKPYGKRVDGAVVEQGDLAQVMRSCFRTDPSGFVPSGIRIYLLGRGLIQQSENERFNTIAHEISHRVIGTTDAPRGTAVYGRNNALALANLYSADAVRCAENWGYFYQEVMERQP